VTSQSHVVSLTVDPSFALFVNDEPLGEVLFRSSQPIESCLGRGGDSSASPAASEGRSANPPRMGTKTIRCLGLLAVMGLIGCAHRHPDRLTPTSSHELLVSQRSTAGEELWTAAKEVLRDHGFRLDRVDRGAGLITTMPRTSQQAFEFWRNDVCTSFDLWEATLNPIRRWAEVRFVQNDVGAWTDISVTVHKERFSAPDRQFNNTGSAYQFFGNQLPSTTGQTEVTSADERWLDAGRDAALEGCLVQQVLEYSDLAGIAATAEDPSAPKDPNAE